MKLLAAFRPREQATPPAKVRLEARLARIERLLLGCEGQDEAASVLGRVARLEAYYNKLLGCVRTVEESMGRLESELAELKESGVVGGGFGAGVHLGRIEGRLAMLGETVGSVERMVRAMAEGGRPFGAQAAHRRSRSTGAALSAEAESNTAAPAGAGGERRGRILEALLTDNLELLAGAERPGGS